MSLLPLNQTRIRKRKKSEIDSFEKSRDDSTEQATLSLIREIVSKNLSFEELNENVSEKHHWLKRVGLPLLVLFVPMASLVIYSVCASYLKTGVMKPFPLMLSISLSGALAVYFYGSIMNTYIYLSKVKPQVERALKLYGLLCIQMENGNSVGMTLSSKLSCERQDALADCDRSVFSRSYSKKTLTKGFEKLDAFLKHYRLDKIWGVHTDELPTGDKIYSAYAIVEAYASLEAQKGVPNRFFKTEDEYFNYNFMQ